MTCATMSSTRALRGVVGNLLGAYVSRYSSYQGYWLFGFLVQELDLLEFDLLGVPERGLTPTEVAGARAIAIFRDQLAKAGVDPMRVRSGTLSLRRDRPANLVVSDIAVCGCELLVSTRVQAVSGRWFLAERRVYVAPHDPQLERRSAGTGHPPPSADGAQRDP
jgi:hypothetical protein